MSNMRKYNNIEQRMVESARYPCVLRTMTTYTLQSEDERPRRYKADFSIRKTHHIQQSYLGISSLL